MKHVSFVWRILIAAVFALVVAQSAQAAPLLKDGDRVVIYGDSITEQRLYSRYLQQYLYCRYPELKIRVFNAGWGGDRAPGGLNRLERDVLSLNPTVVTLFFGMNDGSYTTLNDGIVNTYRTGMEGIIKALQAKNVRVIVFTPGCVDPDKRANLKACDYNKTLEALGVTAIELAKKYNCAYANVFQPMLAFQTQQKAAKADFTMIPDAVHPNPAGHLVMTRTMLEGFGAEPMPALGTLDLASGKGEGLRITKRTDSEVVMETAGPARIPFWFDASVADTMRDSGFLAMAGQKLTIRGLVPGTYQVAIDGVVAGKFTAQELADGAFVAGTYSERGKRIHDLSMRKENSYFNAWRDIRLPFADVPESKAVVDGLMAADEGYHKVLHALATPPAKNTITLTVAASGTNLALKKRYEASDPNRFNWGIGCLTDGSWENSSRGCFATGDKNEFPKHVTIDLEQTARIGTVVLGVPNFGSTKTVKVAVSADGQNFTEVGSYQFTQRKEERHTYSFAPVQARYVRVIYPDYYEQSAGYTPTFSFTTEVEVYGPAEGSLKMK